MCGPRDYNVFPKWPARSFGLDTPGLRHARRSCGPVCRCIKETPLPRSAICRRSVLRLRILSTKCYSSNSDFSVNEKYFITYGKLVVCERVNKKAFSAATDHEDRGLLCPSTFVTLGAEVHEQMFQSGDQSGTNSPMLTPKHSFIDPLKGRRLSRPCPARDLNPGSVVWKRRCIIIPLLITFYK
ncbi:hypothetical protein TNCV_1171671 [Trichonephila clavipes]|uniref:Uncharacterized protein n=1 Tax=Trichonephila clavipes TaxID=2585209 RepID=A0A8X6S5E3_TRICX|nr:hypothetical protein TNCV_1171671 [Trichonephila clavipes]